MDFDRVLEGKYKNIINHIYFKKNSCKQIKRYHKQKRC